MADITLDCRYNNATIKINDVPHLSFRTDAYRGFQTWPQPDRWCIQLVLTGAVVLLEYDTAEKFNAVVTLIQRAVEQ